MLIKIFIINVLLSVVFCCHIENVKVKAVLRDGSPLTITVNGCIERKSFLDGEKTRNVVELDIDAQNIPVLEKDAIRHMIHLRTLTIRNTNLKTIAPDVFRNVDRVETVDFVSNKIDFVADGVFNYQDFKYVSLFDNNITAMDDLAFSYMNHLQSLNMSYNKLNNFKGSWFYILPNLTSIDFRHNMIEVLPRNAFGNITNLTDIYLSHNNILNIEPNAFQGLSSLEHLDLKYNLLKTLNMYSFPQNMNINILNLSANRLNSISKAFFDRIFVKTILHHGNPLNCFCYRNMEMLFELKGIKIELSPECSGLNIPVCAIVSATACEETYNEKLTEHYYRQIVNQRNSECVRPFE